MRRKVCFLLACGLFLAVPAVPAPGADPPAPGAGLEAQLGEVRSLVTGHHYLQALEDLQFIARQVQDLRHEEAAQLLPPPPPGWSAGEAVALADADDAWSRRLAVRREYRRLEGDGVVEITLDFHAPDLAAVALSLNPLFAVGDPRVRILEIGGQKARLTYTRDTAEGELRLVLGGEVLVLVRGHAIVSEEILADWARRLDFAEILSRAGR